MSLSCSVYNEMTYYPGYPCYPGYVDVGSNINKYMFAIRFSSGHCWYHVWFYQL